MSCLSYCIRLAHKYGIEDLLEDSIQQLQELWPATYPDWLVTVPNVYVYSTRAITAVNLARLTETDSVLPSAFYACCQHSEGKLLAGATLSDGSVDQLHGDDQERRTRARARFIQMLTNSVDTTFSPPPENEECRPKAYEAIQEYALDLTKYEDSKTDVLDVWDDRLD